LRVGITVDHCPQSIIVIVVIGTRMRMEGKLDALATDMIHAVLKSTSGTKNHQASTSSGLTCACNHVTDVGGTPTATTRRSGAVNNSSRANAVRSVVRSENVWTISCNQSGLIGALEATSAVAVILAESFLLSEAVGSAVGRFVHADSDCVAGTNVHQFAVDLCVHVGAFVERLTVVDGVDGGRRRSSARSASGVGANRPVDLLLLRDIRRTVEFDPLTTPAVATTTFEGSSAVQGGASLPFEGQKEAATSIGVARAA
jgi:hypothetical protein